MPEPGIVGVTGVEAMLLYLAREIAPKYPTAGLTPFADCQLATAALVMGPKKPD